MTPTIRQTIRLLLADDQALVRGALASLLGLEPDLEVVAEVGRGDDVVPAAREARPDVALLDVEMPGLDGIAATQKLKEDPRTQHLPILILTGYPMRGIAEGALEAGADAFITKPCLPEDLEHHVLRLIDRSADA